jgi:hypothetical protein
MAGKVGEPRLVRKIFDRKEVKVMAKFLLWLLCGIWGFIIYAAGFAFTVGFFEARRWNIKMWAPLFLVGWPLVWPPYLLVRSVWLVGLLLSWFANKGYELGSRLGSGR